MANALYDAGREGFLGSSVADYEVRWDSDNIKLQLINETDDTPNLATDDFLDDIAAAARPTGGTTTGNLANKTSTAGVADADDLSPAFSSVSQGGTSDATMESFSAYKDTGVESTSLLLFNIDTATGLPVTVNGGDINVTWDPGADRIFKL